MKLTINKVDLDNLNSSLEMTFFLITFLIYSYVDRCTVHKITYGC